MGKRYFDDGKLTKASVRFGRNNKKVISVNFWENCTYLHLRNLNNDKSISLGIDEFEELQEILLDKLPTLDKKIGNR